MKLAKNMIFNFANLALVILSPMITIPYISRIFSPEIMGSIAYTSSTTRWFAIFAGFALIIYAGKVIAASPEKDHPRVFGELFWLNLASTTLILCLYFPYIFFEKNYHTLFLIQSLVLFGNLFECTWYFTGSQNFKIGLMRNVFTKALSILLILILVKKPEDLNTYLLIQLGTNFVSSFYLFTNTPKLPLFNLKLLQSSLQTHFKPALIFFIPFFAAQIYTVFDKILILKLSNAWELGIYDAATKVIIMLMVVSTSITGVLLPKIAQLASLKKHESIINHLKLSLLICNFTGFNLMFGIYCFSEPFVEIFFGSQYLHAAQLLKILAPMLVLLAWNSISSLQILYPMNSENSITKSVILGSLVSLGINTICLPSLGAQASSWAWLISELFIVLLQFYFAHKLIKFQHFYRESIPYILIAFAFAGAIIAHHWFQQINLQVLGVFAMLLSSLVSWQIFRSNKKDFKETLSS